MLVAISFFLALALSKPVGWLTRRLPGNNRVAPTALAFVAIVALLSFVVFLVVPPIVDQSVKLADNFPTLMESAQKQWRGLDAIINKYNLQPQIDSAVKNIKDNVAGWVGQIGQSFVSGVLGPVISFITSGLIVLFMTFFMLVEGPNWKRRMWLFYKDTEKMEYHQHLLERMYNVVTSYFVGQVTVSGIGGICAGLVVFLLSFIFPMVPHSLAMPVVAITFLLSLIPMFGATIAGILASLLIAFNNVPAAVIYIVYFFIYQQFENNVIAPAVQSRTVQLSALAIIISVVVGTVTLGVVGGIVSIPIAGCLKILMSEHIKRVQSQRERHEAELEKQAKKRRQQKAELLKAAK